MATAAPPFEVGDLVKTDSANTYGVPANTNGRVVRCYNDVTSTGLGWIVVVRVPDDLRGSFDYHLRAADVVAQ